MEILNLDPELIQVAERLRAVDPDYVALLVESMRQRGQDTPIRVTMPDEAGFHRLIAGAHRLAAARVLGWASIDAMPFEGTPDEAELLEVEENLMRRELSELDRAAFMAKHKMLWERLYPQTRHGGDKRRKPSRQVGDMTPHPVAERFSAVIAKKLGWSERTVQRAVTRYGALSAEIRARLANTWLADNGSALDDLIGRGEPLTEIEQHAVLDLLLEPTSKVRNVNLALRQVRRLPAPDTAGAELNALKAAWKRAGRKARQDFRAFIQGEGN